MRRILAMIFILIVAVSCAGVPVSLFPASSFSNDYFSSLPLLQRLNPHRRLPRCPHSLPPWYLHPLLDLFSPPLWFRQGFAVLYHPDDVLYVGDQVSFEVIPPPGYECKGFQRTGAGRPPERSIFGTGRLQ